VSVLTHDEVAHRLYWTKEYLFKELTLEVLLEAANEAHALGLDCWATETNKEQTPWKTRIVFWEASP
jgi:hypothetical protein